MGLGLGQHRVLWVQRTSPKAKPSSEQGLRTQGPMPKGPGGEQQHPARPPPTSNPA